MLTTLEARDKQIAELLFMIAKLEYQHESTTQLLIEADRALRAQKKLEPAKRTMYSAVSISALFVAFYFVIQHIWK